MTKSPCPLCHQKTSTIFAAMPGYLLRRCHSCRFVWDGSTSEDTLKIYDQHYFVNDNSKGGYANYFEGMKINSKTFTDRLKKITRKTGYKSDYLDVGSALGDCLLEAKKLGWTNIIGVEPSKYASAQAAARGVKIINSSLEKSKLKPDTYNIITSQDVIEHVPDPVSNLKNIYQLLRKDGWAFIVTPNIEGIWSRLLGKWWYHYKPGEHISYFSPTTIRYALKKAGFSHIEVHRTYHVMSLEYVLNRLKYYSPIFSLLLKMAKTTPVKDIPFKLFTGELEVWAQKN